MAGDLSALNIPDAEMHDLGVIAAQEGISILEAYHRFGWGEDFSDGVAAIAEAYPNNFVGSAMDQEGEVGGVLYFAGPAPDVARYVDSLTVPVEVIENAGVPQAVAQEAVERIHYLSRERLDQGTPVFTEADEASGLITVSIGTRTDDPQAVPVEEIQSAAEQELAATQGSYASRLEVQVRTEEGGGGSPETIRGGAILNFPVSGNLACTSGWAVRSTSGTGEGLITARHCDNDLEYTNRNVLTWVRSLPANRGDIQYNRSSEDVGHAFYYGVGDYRDVDAPLGTPSNDQYLCFFGRKTENHCDNVRDTYVCANDNCNLVSMDDHDTDGGDSGGPWYYGSRPYGVHHGYYTSWFQGRALWTPIYNTIADISVQIKVGTDG